MKKRKDLDAIIFGTNYLGVAGLEAMKKLKLSIPDDLAVLCFDDHDLFRIHKPAISVIAQPIEEIAQTVIDTLLFKLQNPTARKKPPKFITLTKREQTSSKYFPLPRRHI